MVPIRSVTVTLQNKAGLHARPAAELVRVARKFTSRIFVVKDGEMTDAKSVLGVMALAATRDSELIIAADGDDEEQAISALKKIIEDKFGET